jgi:hypothetical protein
MTNERFIAALEILPLDEQIILVKHIVRQLPAKEVLDFINSKPVRAWVRHNQAAINMTAGRGYSHE